MSNKWFPFFGIAASVFIFIIVSLVYFKPVLQGKILPQNDVVNYFGGAQESIDFWNENGESTFWTNSMFGGMPTYQLSARFKHKYISELIEVISFIPRPSSFVFMLLAGFFVLGLVLFKNWIYALTGSLFFAFSSYFFIIIEAGHITKLISIAYFAPLLAGTILLYRKKYFLGFILFTFSMNMQLTANHLQMTYYLFLAMLLFVLFQFYNSFKNKELNAFFKSSIIAFAGVLLAVGMNSARIYTTYNYSKETIRGKGPLVTENASKDQNGLDYNYITNWSYGKLETLNLVIPNFMGGSSVSEKEDLKNYINGLQTKPASQEEFDAVQSNISQTTYWGNQPFTSGPAYQGVVVVFLFILGLFIVPNKLKWWLFSATILSIVLAWGKNIDWLTRLMVDYLPLYNKFRAVSSALVIAEFTVPILSILSVYHFFSDKKLAFESKKTLFYVGGSSLLFLAVLYIAGPFIFVFLSDVELQNISNPNSLSILKSVAEDIKLDRIILFKQDVLRSFVYVFLAVATLLLYAYKTIKIKEIFIVVIALLATTDLWMVNKRYINDDNFVKDYLVSDYFPTETSDELNALASSNGSIRRMLSMVPINKELAELKQKDKSTYRVFNTLISPFNETNTSYFHQSIGGYHGAKLRNYQDIIDNHLSGSKMNFEVLNMLNTKYILLAEDKIELVSNPEANGNAWFVNEIKWVENDVEGVKLLDIIDTKKTALLTNDLKVKVPQSFQIKNDSILKSDIQLVAYKPNHLSYKVKAEKERLAVFSEVYYSNGWKAFKNQKTGKREDKLEILPVNYLLRGALLPKGEYFVDFYFDPDGVKVGQTLNLIFHVLFFIAFAFCLFFSWKKKEWVSL